MRRSDSRGSIHRSDQARAQNTRVSGTILCPFGQSHKAIGHESRIGSCVATHLSTGQPSGLYVSETNGVVTKGYGSTRERKRCSASGAETKRHTRLAEDRSRIEDASSNSWAECRENNFGIEPRGGFSLDIPFYRIATSGVPPKRFNCQPASGNPSLRFVGRDSCSTSSRLLHRSPGAQ